MKRTLIVLLALVIASTTFLSGCGINEKTSTNNGERMTITVAFPAADESWQNDEYYKYITDKLGINIQFETLSSDSALEKGRIWIASGDMPDVVWSDLKLGEYMNYAEQGMVRALPDDWEEKYPNVAFSMEMTGLLNELKGKNDGKIYSLIVPNDVMYPYLDDFRAAFKEKKDISAMLRENKYIALDSYGFAYRKDWAEKLGIETDYIMEYEEFLDMARKFKEADLGGVGSKNAIGIAVDHTEAPNIFVTAFNTSYKYFHKDESGKYICGLLEDSTTEGVKEYSRAYREGLLSPDFYTQKTGDLDSLFCSQRAGIIFPRASQAQVTSLIESFSKANPGLNPEECIGVCWVKSPDGKVHARENKNYYGNYYFNPELSDEKMAKILELADYCSSREGGPQVKLGVPGVDFKKEGDEYIITREKDENGALVPLKEKYPSYEFFRQFLNPQYDQSTPANPYAAECKLNLMNAKKANELSLFVRDVVRDTYSADDYVKFNAKYEVNALLAEVILADGDVETNWNKKKKEIETEANKVLKNMNDALLN